MPPSDFEQLGIQLHWRLDGFLNHWRASFEGRAQQVQLGLEELEDGFSEDLIGAVDAQLENNVSESDPLLNEVRENVRSRVRRPVGPSQQHTPVVMETEQIFYRRIQLLFEEMLERLQQRWNDALDWLQRTAAACLQGLRRALEFVCGFVQSLCSSMGQVFGSLIQV